jgi:hypothetical protein
MEKLQQGTLRSWIPTSVGMTLKDEPFIKNEVDNKRK